MTSCTHPQMRKSIARFVSARNSSTKAGYRRMPSTPRSSQTEGLSKLAARRQHPPPGGTGFTADKASIEQSDSRARLGEPPGDRCADETGADDGYVGARSFHISLWFFRTESRQVFTVS